ncbi:YciE/YciF ferroxidase family protein [Chryseobacterium chendengshani]|uniref:YciE/YciF ferroxidase family protein n=1 Tax=unclassified Chryseobacterium TaxID=2593645 RepID=UPI001C64328A|nr:MULTISPECIES: ferritin-like domain-containing protein [unclassified Chryseobacterium]MBW7676358.1 ferritin-like domain-containing protein [Chryseobacterium sp. LJ756]MBW8523731.1 ferritin-like domain-containing protein [Chryseobacterium sp. LJ668]QYK16675.1 ferritin-like domain-containing protein [Chryseobacterium sp. LJ668]
MAKSTSTKTTVTDKTENNTSTKSKPSASTGKIKAKSDAAENLRDFLIDGLKDLYWAETHLSKALVKMEKNATSPKLKEAINNHKTETDEQVSRLEQVFEALGEKAKAVKCDAMDGLIKEGEGIMEETEAGAVRDAGIIAAAQKVEHYEIASYGTLVSYCKLLQEEEAMNILQSTLDEEKNCDTLLTELAISEINLEAAK